MLVHRLIYKDWCGINVCLETKHIDYSVRLTIMSKPVQQIWLNSSYVYEIRNLKPCFFLLVNQNARDIYTD